ncbi:GAF and ANTAR domain-containing protein [Nocardioides salsibiostraticola]
MISSDRLSDLFVDVADTLVDAFDIVDFLHTLSEYVAEISGAAAVGLLLADQRGNLQLMAATTEMARVVELHQIRVNDGPCLDCFRTGVRVVNADLEAAEALWPVFTPHALAAGFRSVHAFPMRLRNQTIGALNLFGEQLEEFDEGDLRLVQALADVATIAILQERSVSRAEALTEQLQGALNSRILIEQAKGTVAQLMKITVDEAFELLRARARANGIRLAEVAQQVLAGDVQEFDPTT